MSLLNAVPSLDLITKYNQSLSRFWHPVMRSTDIKDDRPCPITLLDHDLIVARLNGNLVTMDNLCRHFQVLLSEGEIDTLTDGTEVVRCIYHGWAYGGNGQCLQIPQLKDGKIPPNAKVKTYHIAEKHDVVWICLDSEPIFDIPEFPELSDEGMYAIPVQYTPPWASSIIRMIQSALDDYHFPWLHQGVLGERSKPYAPERKITRVGRQLISEFDLIQPVNVTNYVGEGQEATETTVHYTMAVDMPNVLRLIKKNEQGGTYTVWFAPMPERFNSTPIFWRVVRNYDLGKENDDKVIEMEKLIQSQDNAHVSKQRPWASKPMPIKGVDDALVAYLQWLNDLGISTSL